MRRAVVTGCAGLFGSHFAEYLCQDGWEILGIDDLSGGFIESVPSHDGFHFERVDLNDYRTVRKIFEDFEPHVCYHFAAYAAEGLSPFVRRHNYTQNLLASASVINCCVEREVKMVFTSSMAVYGSQKPPFTEDMALNPVDPYGIAKASTEQDMRCAGVQHGLRWSIVRPHNVVGTRQNIWDRYRNVIGIFIRKAIAGEPLVIFGDGSQVRAFSDIKGYMQPLAVLADGFDGETFNIGADRFVTVASAAEMVKAAAKAKGIDVTITFGEPRHEVKEAYCNHDKAKALLGFNDNTILEEVVAEMFDWALTQPPREVASRQYEVSKGIYEYWK